MQKDQLQLKRKTYVLTEKNQVKKIIFSPFWLPHLLQDVQKLHDEHVDGSHSHQERVFQASRNLWNQVKYY